MKYSYNQKCFRQRLYKKSEHNLMFNSSFPKSCSLWDYVEK